MIVSTRTVGSRRINRPSISGAEDLKNRKTIEARVESINNKEVSQILDVLDQYPVGFNVERDQNDNIVIGTVLHLSARVKIKDIIGEDKYLDLLELLLPHIDKAFSQTFSCIEDHLDVKYLERENDNILDDLSEELFYYNNALKQNKKKHFTHYLLESILNSDFIDKVNFLKRQ